MDNNLQKIKAEIQRRKKIIYDACDGCIVSYLNSVEYNILCELESYIDSLNTNNERPLDENEELNLASQINAGALMLNGLAENSMIKELKNVADISFKNGALWKTKQIIKSGGIKPSDQIFFWKPDPDQMDALHDMIASYEVCSKDNNKEQISELVESLYNDLNKLIE